ncbi:MAG: HPF/RaiA family ribosome-associated protein [Candidatus Omnitrophota bacterium]
MQNLPEITFRGVEHTQELEDEIQRNLEKLERVCDHIISCHLVIEKRQRIEARGNPYRVRLAVSVPPGHQIVVIRGQKQPSESHQPLPVIVHHVFESVVKRLRKLSELQNREVKRHPEQEVNGVVEKIYRKDGYGFIRTDDDSQVYFHRNAVLHNKFDRLNRGDGVHFLAEEGDQGPQATTVRIIEKTEL